VDLQLILDGKEDLGDTDSSSSDESDNEDVGGSGSGVRSLKRGLSIESTRSTGTTVVYISPCRVLLVKCNSMIF
jgi:hypothetical protein